MGTNLTTRTISTIRTMIAMQMATAAMPLAPPSPPFVVGVGVTDCCCPPFPLYFMTEKEKP